MTVIGNFIIAFPNVSEEFAIAELPREGERSAHMPGDRALGDAIYAREMAKVSTVREKALTNMLADTSTYLQAARFLPSLLPILPVAPFGNPLLFFHLAQALLQKED